MVQHNRQSLYSTFMLSSGCEIAVQHLLQWTVYFHSKSNDLKKKKDLILEYGSWTAWETQILISWKCQWEPYSETNYKNCIPTKDYKAKEQKSGKKKKWVPLFLVFFAEHLFQAQAVSSAAVCFCDLGSHFLTSWMKVLEAIGSNQLNK